MKIDKEQVFDKYEGRMPRRILIEGNPGYGKTTLVTKYLYDWSRGEQYIREKFDLVFVIALRNYKGKLENHLLQQCEGIDGDKNKILQAIKAMREKVLLFLDGLDETNETVKDSLLPLLEGDNYRMMSVVVTCRTGLIEIGNKSADDDFVTMGNRVFLKHTIWDKRIQIKGISSENRVEFLQRYLNIDKEEVREKLRKCNVFFRERAYKDNSVIDKESDVNNSDDDSDDEDNEVNFNNDNGDFYECPLFLLLLATLIQEGKIQTIGTKTNLYKSIFNFVINRSLDREKLPGQENEIDIFDLKSRNQLNYGNMLVNFGRLCLEKVKSKSLIFEETELLKCLVRNEKILKLGFLSKQISFFNYEEKEHYEPVHRSFLEFSAAFYLSSLEESEMEKEIRYLLLEFNLWPTGNQLIYPFLGGFLQLDASKLISIFSPYKSLISVFYDGANYPYNVEEILFEVPQTDGILNALSNLSPGNWVRVNYVDNLYSWFVGMLDTYQKMGKTDEISLKCPCELNITDNVRKIIKVNRIQFNISEFELGKNKLKLKDNMIHCQNLIINSNEGISLKFPLILREIKKLRADKIWLELDYEYCRNLLQDNLIEPQKGFINFCKTITDEHLENFTLHYFSLLNIPLSLFQLICSNIEGLIGTGKIDYGINITLSDGIVDDVFRTTFNSFVDSVSKSHLKSFAMNKSDTNVPIPFPLNLFNEERKWKFIGLKGLFTMNDEDLLEAISIEHFCCHGLNIEETCFHYKFLLECKHIQRLSCDDDFISDLNSCDSISELEGLETIQRLDLDVLDEDVNHELLLKAIPLLRNLRHIQVNVFCYDKVLVDIIPLLPSLKRVSIIIENANNMEFLDDLLTLKDETKGDKLILEEIEIMNMDSVSKKFILSLEDCFRKNIIKTYRMTDVATYKIKDLINHFIPRKEFKVSSEWKEESPYTETLDPTCSEIPEFYSNLIITKLC